MAFASAGDTGAGPALTLGEGPFAASDTTYAKAVEISEEEKEERLEQEARAAGFKHDAENWRQAVFIFMDEPESGCGAFSLSMVIMCLIFISSMAFLFETHPYVACTYSSAQPATCGDGENVFGDATSQAACENSQFLDSTTNELRNGTYTAAQPAIGMYADCAAATTKDTCIGVVKWTGFEAEGAAGSACVWKATVTTDGVHGGSCVFEPDDLNVDNCVNWVSPFQYNVVPGDVEVAKQWRYWLRLVECIAIGCFTVEYVIRMAVCTQRPRRNRSFCKYFTKTMNLIDICAIVPFYIELVLGGATSLGVLRILRMARIFRVLKAGNLISELQLFAHGYYRAREGLLLLFFLLFLYLCVFAAVLFLIEYDAQTEACFQDADGLADLCFTDLGGEFHSTDNGCEITMDGCDDNIDGKVIAYERFIQGPSAPGPFNGPKSDCYTCAFVAYNCSDHVGENATSWVISTTSPWDAVTGYVTGACASQVDASGDGTCPGGLPFCGGRITELPCDKFGTEVLGSSVADVMDRPLQQGWYLDEDCLTCDDLGCGTRAFTSIPTTWYFIMATMTTVGYGDHYPTSVGGKIVTGVCMLVGIMVLALPIIVIGNAFEEVTKEQERYEKEKIERLEIKNLERFGSGGNQANAQRVKDQLDLLKAKKEEEEANSRYDKKAAIHTVITLLNICHKETGQDRFRRALEHVMRD